MLHWKREISNKTGKLFRPDLLKESKTFFRKIKNPRSQHTGTRLIAVPPSLTAQAAHSKTGNAVYAALANQKKLFTRQFEGGSVLRLRSRSQQLRLFCKAVCKTWSFALLLRLFCLCVNYSTLNLRVKREKYHSVIKIKKVYFPFKSACVIII